VHLGHGHARGPVGQRGADAPEVAGDVEEALRRPGGAALSTVFSLLPIFTSAAKGRKQGI